MKREYYFALRPGQRVECPKCGNMLEIGEDSSVYCDYCHYYWTLAELLTYLNGETRFPVSLQTKHVCQPTIQPCGAGPHRSHRGETMPTVEFFAYQPSSPIHHIGMAPSREVM